MKQIGMIIGILTVFGINAIAINSIVKLSNIIEMSELLVWLLIIGLSSMAFMSSAVVLYVCEENLSNEENIENSED